MQHSISADSGYTPPLRPFILIDTKIVGGPGKGLFQFLRKAHELYPDGFEPTLAHFIYGEDEPTEFESRAVEERIPLLDLPARTPLDREALALARATIRARGCTLIQTHGYKSHLYGAFLRTLTGLPWIAFAHGWTSENAKVRLYHSLDRLLLPRADHVVAVSKKLYGVLSGWRRNDDTTTIVENAVELPDRVSVTESAALRRALGIAENAPIIGSFGRLSHEKGHRFLIEAFRALENEFPDTVLLIVGSGPEKPLLQRLAMEASASDRIRFIPHVSDITPYFSVLDIFALPSLSEGLPNVVLEAMSFARPVVASAVGALPTAITNGTTGVLVRPGDSSALSAALRALLSDHRLRSKIGQAGRAALYPRFCPAERTRKIVALYRTMTGPDTRGQVAAAL